MERRKYESYLNDEERNAHWRQINHSIMVWNGKFLVCLEMLFRNSLGNFLVLYPYSPQFMENGIVSVQICVFATQAAFLAVFFLQLLCHEIGVAI